MTIVRRLTDMTKELDLAVHTLATYPEMNNPIKMEVSWSRRKELDELKQEQELAMMVSFRLGLRSAST